MGKIENCGTVLFCLLTYLSFFIPQNISHVKLVLFLIILYIAFLKIITIKTFKINKEALMFMFLFLIYSITTSSIGFIRNNPGAWGFFRVNVIYPILLFMCGFLITNKYKFKRIIIVCAIVAICISFYTFLFLFQNTGVIDLPIFVVLDEYSGVGIHQGYVHVTNMNASMLIFLFPLLLFSSQDSMFFCRRDKKLLLISSILCVPTMFISGRRMLWLVMILTLLWFFLANSKGVSLRQRKKRIFLLITVFLIAIVPFVLLIHKYQINIGGLLDRLYYAFSSYDQYGRNNVRIEQIIALFKGFLEYPILGSGAGIGVSDYTRAKLAPWRYELSYMLILYNSGILGVTFYFCSFFVLLKALWIKSKRCDLMARALFVALIMGILANATNPYISSSFDFLLWIFIPIYYLNLNKDEQYCC